MMNIGLGLLIVLTNVATVILTREPLGWATVIGVFFGGALLGWGLQQYLVGKERL